MEPLRSITPDQTNALGRIAAAHAHLDGIMETIIAALVARDTANDVFERALTVIQGQSTSWLVDCVVRLADNGGGHETALRAWARAVRAAANERNGVLHAIWLMQLSPQTTMTMRRRIKDGTRFRAVSLEELNAIAQRQNGLVDQGLDLARRLHPLRDQAADEAADVDPS